MKSRLSRFFVIAFFVIVDIKVICTDPPETRGVFSRLFRAKPDLYGEKCAR